MYGMKFLNLNVQGISSIIIQPLYTSQFNWLIFFSSLYPWPTDLLLMLNLKNYFPLMCIFNIFSQHQAKNGIQEMECCSLESDWIYFHPDASGRIIHVGPNQVKWVFSLVTSKLKVALGSIYWSLYFCQLTDELIVEIFSL